MKRTVKKIDLTGAGVRALFLVVVVMGAECPADEAAPVGATAVTPPPISELVAPREVFAENVRFVAKVRAKVTGKVRFALKTFAGAVVWSAEARIAEGQAAAVLRGEQLAGMEKGGRVLVATVNDDRQKSAYAAVRLRGRIFRDVTEAPVDLRPGDEIVITDLSELEPSEAVINQSVKGKWWRRRYTAKGEEEGRELVCVEQRDLEDPRSCLAPPVTLPLKLRGWYEVWVRTYRHGEGGGIDVRLSGEKYFFHADPLQVSTLKEQTRPPVGALVDVLYRAADLTGQDLVFQQPYGTYESVQKLCNASLAGVRLVKLSDAQVKRLRADRVRADTKRVGFDNDGFSYFHVWAERDPACIARLLEPLRDQSVAFLNVSLGGLGGITIPTPYTGMYQMTGHTRHGDYRANDFVRWCFENDVNIVRVLTERAHEVGLKLFVALMMERSFSPDNTMREHPEWRVTRGRGRWNYAHPEVRAYQVKKIAWIMEHHEIDGFVVDFTRYGYFFNEDEPKKFEHMNAFLRALRAATDRVNAGKERKVLLCCSFADESRFIKHWGTGRLTDQGLDVKTWLAEGLFDILMPEGPTALYFVRMAEGSRTEVWPRKASGYPFETDRILGGKLGPKQIEQGVKKTFDAGAPGIFFFNHDTWTTLGRLGFAEELELRSKTDEVYGLVEGPVVTFATWFPGIEERDAQRSTFKPVTIATDARQNVDGRLILPIRNTFSRAVIARVGWSFPSGQEAGRWALRPETRDVSIAGGQRADVSFRIHGSAPRPTAVPAAMVEFVSDKQVVFRHRLPVRAGPQIVCSKARTAPALDGPGGRTFFDAGERADRRGSAKIGMGYDDEKLYVACECSGIDASKISRQKQKRDAHEIRLTDRFEVLIDANAAEKEHFRFVATPAGAQADAQSYYYPFAGHFVTKQDWNAEWTAQTLWRRDGYRIEMSIPFKVLGRVPKPGDRWRINVVWHSRPGPGGTVAQAWSSPAKCATKPEWFGTLLFE